MNKLVWVVYGLMWLSVAAGICCGIYYTHSIHCLWFFLIPASCGFSITEQKDETNKSNK